MNMHSIQSIATAWSAPGCTLIVSDPEQTGFFWFLFRTQQGCRLLSFPTNSADFSQWSSVLLQSFLGQSLVYWLSVPTAAAKSAKVRQQVAQFLKTYAGPHAVWVLVGDEQAADFGSCRRVLIAPTVAATQLNDMAALFGMERSALVVSGLGVVPARGVLTLDAAAVLLVHAGFVPTRSAEQATSFLQRLLPQDISLVVLAELFFSGHWQSFLTQWAAVSGAYSDMFWVSFWTEQLWRAYWVCWYMQRGQQARARSMSYRLPSTFMQAGWRQNSLLVLRAQYEHISFVDTALKSGSFFTADEAVTSLVALAQ
jgi:hypothetical protein